MLTQAAQPIRLPLGCRPPPLVLALATFPFYWTLCSDEKRLSFALGTILIERSTNSFANSRLKACIRRFAWCLSWHEMFVSGFIWKPTSVRRCVTSIPFGLQGEILVSTTGCMKAVEGRVVEGWNIDTLCQISSFRYLGDFIGSN